MSAITALLRRLSFSARKRRKVLPKAKALLCDQQGAILLIQHPREGSWRLPGGFVHVDETAYEAAVRAVKALTGLHVQALHPIARFDESQFRTDAMYGDFFQMYATLFLVTRWQGEVQPVDRTWKARFFAPDSLPANLHEEVTQALKARQSFETNGQIRVY